MLVWLTCYVRCCRVVCETRALKFGRRLLVDKFADIQQVVQEAEQQRQDQQLPCF